MKFLSINFLFLLFAVLAVFVSGGTIEADYGDSEKSVDGSTKSGSNAGSGLKTSKSPTNKR